MQVATAVYEGVGAQHQLIAAAVAPWNVETGDWLYYMERMLAGLQGYADGIALHIYTHGSDPALVTSEATMDAPFDKRRFHFRAYIDMMDAIPDAMRDLPVYITETDQDVPWLDANNGWVQAAYAEIDRWNQQAGNQRIHCLCLYRWPNYDQWGFVDKLGVHDDLRAVVAKNYTVPQSLVAPVSPSNGAASVTRARAGGAPRAVGLAPYAAGCVVDSYDGCAGLASCARRISGCGTEPGTPPHLCGCA